MVRALARAGARLCIAGRRQAPIDEAANQVRSLGSNAIAISTDVSDSSQVNRLVSRSLAHFGQIDVLINNAGLIQEDNLAPIWEVSDANWRRAMEVNLTGAFYCARAVARHMVDRGRGKIINVASGFGLRGGRDLYTYCVSKGGLIQFTRVLAISLARHGITANTIVPGYIPTEAATSMHEALPRSGEFLVTGKLGRPEDIGPIAVFLVSNASDYMTGEILTLDGGGPAAGLAPTGYAPLAPLEP